MNLPSGVFTVDESKRDFYTLLREKRLNPLRPFEKDDALRIGAPFGEADFFKIFGPFHPIRICMIHTPDAIRSRRIQIILFHEDESRGNKWRSSPEHRKHPLNKRRLAGS